MIYFDYAATTPIHPTVLDTYLKVSKNYYGNPSSLHDAGGEAKQLIDHARKSIASHFLLPSEKIIFTSGGTESNRLALETLLSNTPKNQNHILLSKTEHSSITQFINSLECRGFEIEYVPHLKDGIIDLDALNDLIREETALVIVQHVNPEIGVIQPIEAIHSILQGHNAYLHVDCVQSFGKLSLAKISKCADSFSISSHKIYGPMGVGAIIFPKIHLLQPPLHGVNHEFGFRSGTVNVPGVVAFAAAAERLLKVKEIHSSAWTLRNLLLEGLSNDGVNFQEIKALSSKHQLPGIVGLIFSGMQGQFVMMELNRAGFAVSTGSACQVGMQSPSKTMVAINLSENEAKGFVRISFGEDTNEDDVRKLIIAITKCVKPIQTVYYE
ncbi:cysteine desulfurase family protein [Peribacillus alkalitolerans]|uniref:cysteine desulfurase family protein n=1 Tax=Peribacillus alkalitolerans TaxID=1550385 RepID=UPI0013D143BF|nr:cysteine desulfurase family protein [Peribacillus alkalitolerans]